jgi:hypothetical protein
MSDKKPMDDLFKDLETEVDRLNAATHSIEKMFRPAEEKLQELDIDIEIWGGSWIDATEDREWWSEDDRYGDRTLLGVRFYAHQVGYARLGLSWGLAARAIEIFRPDDGRADRVIPVPWQRVHSGAAAPGEIVTPLRGAPIGVQVGALAEIPAIVRSLTDRVRNQNKAIKDATK